MSLEIQNLSKIINLKKSKNVLFENLNITFPEKGMVAIVGKSGCGKTSLLHIIAGIDTDYQGKIFIDRKDINMVLNYNRKYIAMVYQNYRLFDFLNVYENCIIFNKLKGLYISRKEVEKLLTIFHLQHVKNKMPDQLSGGQKQKVALIRAFLTHCPILLCDEPTGALNPENKRLVYRFLQAYSKQHLVIVVSHDQKIKNYCDHVIDFQQLENHYLFSCPKYHLFKCQISNIHYSLFKESLKMLWYQRNKLIIIFLSQILLFMTVTLLISGNQGLENHYTKMHEKEINNELIYITKKNKDAFSNEELTRLEGKYQCFLEKGKITNVDYFQSSPIDRNMKINEVIINRVFYKNIKSHRVRYAIENNQYLFKVKEVINDGYEEPILYYSSVSLPDELKALTLDVTTCYVFVDDYLKVSSYIDQLDQKYEGYCFVEQKYDAYHQLIQLSQVVCFLFIAICIFIVTVLMFFVLLSMFLELQKYYAVFLCNGMSYRQYYMFILKKIILICINNAFFSSLFCVLMIIVFNAFDLSYFLFEISHIFLLPEFFEKKYTLYIFYGVFYCGIGVILFLIMVFHLKRMNLIEILREE